MTQLFGIPVDTLTPILLTTTLVIVGIVILLALSNLLFFKIGVRNIPRRRAQMVLITVALMLSTTLLSSVLATGDVMTAAVQTVAVYNLGGVDEMIDGGQGDLGFFTDGVYYVIQQKAKHDPDVAAVGAALVEPNLLLADYTSRQVRSKVTALGIIPDSEKGFGGMQNDVTKKPLTIAQLGPNEVYLNHTAAQLLNAHAGDTIYLYSQRWPNRRYQFHVAAIVVDGGLVGQKPYLLSNISIFRGIEQRYDDITNVYVSNRTGGGISDADRAETVAQKLQQWSIPGTGVHVHKVKQEGVQVSQKAEDIFSRVFTLFTLFALAISLLLIFLIFVLLAAERRVEMGMARAIGVQRRHLILMFLFEGAVYDVIASLFGLGLGVGIGVLLVTALGPTLERFNFPLKLTFQLHSLIISYCLGVIFTFGSVALSAWLVSRMTVVEAMRDLSEPGRQNMSLGELFLRLLGLLRDTGRQLILPRKVRKYRIQTIRRILFEHLPDTVLGLIRSLILLGFLPLLAGYWCMQYGLANAQIVYFSIGLSLIILGAGLLLKSFIGWIIRIVAAFLPSQHTKSERDISRLYQTINTRIFITLVGIIIVAYWALPFDVLSQLGLPRFQGGIEVFFLAGSMMVVGTICVLITDAELFIRPLVALCANIPNLYTAIRLAVAYPLQRRFRTGISVTMFSLVVFAMTVMAVITNAMQNTYTNIDTQTGGYDIQAVTYFHSVPNLPATLASHGINPGDFSAIGVRTSTLVGAIQPEADLHHAAGWKVYPAQIVDGGFLQGYGLQLAGRARGYASDAAIWQALQTHPNYALIDSSALPYRPNSIINAPVYDPNAPLPADAGSPSYPPGIDPGFLFGMTGIYQGDTNFTPTPLWVTDAQQTGAIKLTIIGVVDNSDSAHFGLYISRAAYKQAHIDPNAPPSIPVATQSNNLFQTTYYFKVAPGQDKNALSLALGSAYLDNGMETTVLADAIWAVRGPRIFLSNVLLGIVGLTLLLGVMALAITGTRAVIERRQQIGMLRALGCHRRLIQGAFLCESFFVGALGCILGVTLGLILASNIFAANFFEQYQTGLTFSVPWQEIALIVGIALLSSFLGALLPAWQAGRVAPAEAIRYQ